MNATCIAVVLLAVTNLPGYAGNSQIGIIIAVVYGSDSFGRIAGVPFFIYIMLLMAIFTIVGLLLKGGDRIRYEDVFMDNQAKGKNEAED